MAIANAFLEKKQLHETENLYSLKVLICENCFLAQLEKSPEKEEIFTSGYVYFSSISKSWLEHSKNYVHKVIPLLGLNKDSFVVEIASNDGYLLQYFRQAGIPCLGIEPTQSTADIALGRGIDTWVKFFCVDTARQLVKEKKKADLIIGNNVLAHVPDLNDFVQGLKTCLSNYGVATFEFPHLIKLIDQVQFDTIYHEHYYYFSLYTIKKIFESHGFDVFDVEEIPTHGGSLRVYIKHQANDQQRITRRVNKVLEKELDCGVNKIGYYSDFQNKADTVCETFKSYLHKEKSNGKEIVAFGAAAKGNTFLNYCGIGSDLISYVVDETPAKQWKYLPQSHIPIYPISCLAARKPDVIVIIPWNFKNEILDKLKFTKEWGAKLVSYIPVLEIQ
jgi:SAM-dependent methyltransferase